MKNCVVVGASGSLGHAFVSHLLKQGANVHALSRSPMSQTAAQHHVLDLFDEDALHETAQKVSLDGPIDCMIVATGMLHENGVMPEKSLREITQEKLHRMFQINAFLPALMAKHFLSLMNKTDKSYFACMSARVGSITDNHLGGWYGYRAAKSALNMIVKTAAIEVGRTNKSCVVVGFHPGTVDTDLSRPFHSHIDPSQILTPEYSVTRMMSVLSGLSGENSGKCYAYDGQEILP